ncbi:hypothetical protein SZ54_4047 [Rhizobium sp. UR51a]|nr:hypothetical protein SZ54_4047 [Rhizobium sp. UR51a]
MGSNLKEKIVVSVWKDAEALVVKQISMAKYLGWKGLKVKFL